MKRTLRVLPVVLSMMFISGCSSLRGGFTLGGQVPVNGGVPVRPMYGVNVSYDVDPKWQLGAELTLTNDVTGEDYQLQKKPSLCYFGCTAVPVTSSLIMSQYLLDLRYFQTDRLEYHLGYGKYKTYASAASNELFDPVYEAPPGDSLPAGTAFHVGAGYVVQRSTNSQIVLEGTYMYLHGDGSLVKKNGVREDLRNLSAAALLIRFEFQ